MSDIFNNSWNTFDDKYAEEYLHYFPKTLHNKAAKIIFNELPLGENISVLDVGCGNGQLLPLLLRHSPNFEYTGIDFSVPLLEKAKKVFESNKEEIKNSSELITGDVLDINNYKKIYDVSIAVHLVELVSSPELLLSILSKTSRYVAVIWYEYPRIEHSKFEIKPYVNSHNEKEQISSPYLRSSYSSGYYNYMLQSNNLSLVKKIPEAFSDKNVLTIYKTNID